MISSNRRARLARATFACLTIALAASTLAAQTPKRDKGIRFYLSGFGAFVNHTEFPNAFMSSHLGLYVAGMHDSGLVFGKADPGYGFTAGIIVGPDFDATGSGGGNRGGIYFELTYHPGYKYPDMAESDRRYYFDAGLGRFIDETVMFVQTGRKTRFMGLNFGGVYVPFRKIPVGLDIFGGLWSAHSEFVSGTVAYYDGRQSIQLVKDLLEGDYEGRGKFVKTKIGFVLGTGLKIYPARFISIDARYTLNLVNSRKESTNLYYVDSGETVMKGIAGFGNVASIGLTVYF